MRDVSNYPDTHNSNSYITGSPSVSNLDTVTDSETDETQSILNSDVSTNTLILYISYYYLADRPQLPLFKYFPTKTYYQYSYLSFFIIICSPLAWNII